MAPAPDSRELRSRAPARALWIALAAIAALRISLTFVPSMAVWGLNVQRFVPGFWAWALLLVPVAALTPALARPLAAWLDRRHFDRWSWRVACAVAAAILVWVQPDRVWFTGDFIGRQFSLDAEGQGLAWYTHAMPLDAALHQHLGRLLVSEWGLAPNGFGRVLGAVEAAALAWLALSFALTLGLTGAAAMAAASLVFWGGWLALFTGYNKALSEMVLAVGLFGVLGVRMARDGRGPLALACTLGAALLIHRSALAMIPAFGVAWGYGLKQRAAREGGAWRPGWLAPLVIPALVLGLTAPHLVTLIRRYDLALLGMPGVHRAHGSAGDTRALDLLNVILCLSPVGALARPLGLASGRAWRRRPETVFLASLVVPLALVAVVFYPPEGLFRFWDIVAPVGVALSLFAAWGTGGIIEAAPLWRWLAVALSCATACSALLWLVHDADTGRGLTRVRAFLSEPPARAPELRASAYEFLGFRLIDLGRPAEAADAFAYAADVIPSPRVLRQWAIAETMAGNPVAAQSVLRLIVERDPENRVAWRQLAARSAQLGDTAEVARSLRAIVRLDPGDREAQEALRRILTPLGGPARRRRPRVRRSAHRGTPAALPNRGPAS